MKTSTLPPGWSGRRRTLSIVWRHPGAEDDTWRAVRRLLMTEPEAGSLLPASAVESLGQLIGCDGFGIGEADRTGYVLQAMTVPSGGIVARDISDRGGVKDSVA